MGPFYCILTFVNGMPSTIRDLSFWLYNYSLATTSVLPILQCCIYLLSTTKTRRWTTSFNIAYALLAVFSITLIHSSVYYLYTTAADGSEGRAVVADIVNLHVLFAETWMVYISLWESFKLLSLVVIIGVGARVWTAFMILSERDAATAGSTVPLILVESSQSFIQSKISIFLTVAFLVCRCGT